MDKSHQAIFRLLTYKYKFYKYKFIFDGEFTQKENKLLTDYANNFIATAENDELADIQAEEISQIIEDAASDYRKAILNIPIPNPEEWGVISEWDILRQLVTKDASLINQKSRRRMALTILLNMALIPEFTDDQESDYIELIHSQWVGMNDGWTEHDFQECLDLYEKS